MNRLRRVYVVTLIALLSLLTTARPAFSQVGKSGPDDAFWRAHGITSENLWGSQPVLSALKYKPDVAASAQSAAGLSDQELAAIQAIALNCLLEYQALYGESQAIAGHPKLALAQKRERISQMRYNDRVAKVTMDAEAQTKKILTGRQYAALLAWANGYYQHLKEAGAAQMRQRPPDTSEAKHLDLTGKSNKGN